MSGFPTGTVTFLFTDIEGSSVLLQHLGDRYADLLANYRRLLRTALEQHGGHEVDTAGDTFFAAFSRARDAVAAAVAAQQTLIAHPWPADLVVRARMGLHTGEPLSVATGYVGMDVHRVARICAVGHGGQILLSHTTRNLLEEDLPPGVRIQDLGVHRLKDLSSPAHLYQVVIAGLPSDFPPLRSLDTRRNNLPVQLTTFIGREREIVDVKQALSRAFLLTLTGPGGCGKTRLALQVAGDLLEEYPDGVWFVELAAVSDPIFVPQTVAAAIGVREEPGRPLADTLVDHLRHRTLLLVLDNCEHVVSACAQLVNTLLRRCPPLRILATSRHVFDIEGEATYSVPSLSLPEPQRKLSPAELIQFEAVRLFMERAAISRPGFVLTDTAAPAVLQICRALDGIPLAIELAVARLRALSVTQLAERLDDRFRLLTGGSQAALPRQQTLQATMDWSYRLLSAHEQTLLRQLSVFVGGFTLEAVEGICQNRGVEGRWMLDLLTDLIDKSLVMVDHHGTTVRYRLLETVRQYARERLEDSSAAVMVRRRHRDWYLAFAEESDPGRLVAEELWLDRMGQELDNLRAALELSFDNGESEAGLRLAVALNSFWQVRGYWSEGRLWLEAGLARGCGAPPAVRAKALNGAGILALSQGDYQRARTLGEESLVMHRDLRDKVGIASSLRILGNVMYERGNYKAARELHEESLACAREAEDKPSVAAAAVNIAIVASHEGDYDLAKAMCRDSLAVFREVRDRRGTAFALNMLGILASDEGDYVTARSWYEESLTIRRELGDRRGIAASISSLARVAREQANYTLAQTLCEDGLRIRRELGDKHGIAASLADLGLVAWYLNDSTRAAALLGESLTLRRAQGSTSGVAECLEGLAKIAQLRPDRAATLFAAAEALRKGIGAPLSPADRADRDCQLDAVRTALGEEGFTTAWQQGYAMTLDQASQFALTAVPPSPEGPSTT